MNCEQAKTEIIAYLKGELSFDQEKALTEHMAGCPDCRKELNAARKVLNWTEAASEKTTAHTVKQIILQAIEDSASDVHVEPQMDNSLRVRYRIDGVLHDVTEIAPAHREGVIARIKMISEMNVSDASLPQDGRFALTALDKEFDLRVSSMPTIYGEEIAIRILDKASAFFGLDRIGLADEHLRSIENLLRQPNGLIVVAGPTGSGKTTTIYSMLLSRNNESLKLMTVENPVEYSIPGASQTQVNARTGLTYATALRAILKQDPDIVYVGDMEDKETVCLTAHFPLTGHLVITSLHANDSAAVIDRLTDPGVGDEPYVIGTSLIGIIVQRLARKICSSCKEELKIDLDDPKVKMLGITEEDLATHKIFHGRGCEQCRNTGYKGRMGIYEVLTLDRQLADMISSGASGTEVIEAAHARGFKSMVDDGKRKVLDGITTVDEAFRVLFY